MIPYAIGVLAIAVFLGLSLRPAAASDCKRDLGKLGHILKTKNLSAVATAILKSARRKAGEAEQNYEDARCERILTEAMTIAGVDRKSSAETSHPPAVP
jgi:hypothetical protein